MIIGIDGRALQGTLTGVGRYVVELCRSLDRLLPDASFIIYSNKPVTMPVVSERWKLRLDDRFLFRRLKANVWLKLRCGKLIHEHGVKLFWATAPLLPRLRSEVRCVMTIYDLNFLLVPHTMIASHLLA